MKIKTQNPEWGFYGTTVQNLDATDEQAARLFAQAGVAVAKHLAASRIAATPEQVRAYLDSRCGRHLADAINATVSKNDKLPSWMARDWKRFQAEVAREGRAS